jgi:two-component system cell cycle sensor histidine kinase/response regulator CckA
LMSAKRDKAVKSRSDKRRVGIPLGLALTMPFVLVILVAVGLTSYLAHRNDREATSEVVGRLLAESSLRVEQRLESYLDKPHEALQMDLVAMRQGQVDATDMEKMGLYLWQQDEIFSGVTIGFGSADGELVSANVASGYLNAARQSATGINLIRYASSDGTPSGRILREIPDWDLHSRPWYRLAVEGKKLAWTDISTSSLSRRLDITAVAPSYDVVGRLQGVFFVDVPLDQISQFLRGMDISPSGQVFIMETTGSIVASSSPEPPYVDSGGELLRLDASASKEPAIAGVAALLKEEGIDLSTISESYEATLSINGESSFVRVISCHLGPGLDWLVATVVPEGDFLANANSVYGRTLLIILAATVLSICVAFLVARWVSRPLSRLAQASTALADGMLDCRLDISRIDEVGELAKTFNVMTLRLKQTVVGLREAQNQLHEVHRLAQLGVWSWDPIADAVTWNEELFQISGRDQRLGAPSFKEHPSLYVPESWERLESAAEEAIASGTPYNLDLEMLRPDGERRWVNVSGGAERDSSGTVVRLHGTVQDMTERVRTEESLLESEEQLHQSQKMEAVGQLAGGIAHDFNNLLTVILGYSEQILESRSPLGDETRRALEQIKRAGERASELTHQILAFSRRQTLRPQVVLLDEVIRGIEPLLRRTIGEDIDLHIVESSALAAAELDPHQFEQVVMNLVLNARDAMPAGGRLTVETASAELDEEFSGTHAGTPPGSYVMLRISDTGVGMDAVTQERIFEPFYTTKAVGAGTGLGLSTAYGIVKQSNGSIFVTSEPGRGSSFVIYLPQAKQPEASDERPVSSQAAGGGRETIMVVEDEEALRGLIELFLAGAGYKTLTFASAQEALVALQEAETGVDLLLTDVMLSGAMQGHDLARAVLAVRPELPVLYISGYARDVLVHAGRLDEGVNLLEKPFTSSSLKDMVRQVLDMPRG